MTARAIWNGNLVLGDAKLAVKLYSAVQDRKVHFHLLHAKDLTPVQQRIVRKTDGKEVPPEEQLKAIPVDADTAVILRPEELEKAEPPASRDVEFMRFVPALSIADPWYERPYYVGPDKDESGYFAVVEALERNQVAGIARWVMRKKRYVGALSAIGGYLMMITLRRAEQVLSVSGIEVPATRQPDVKELALAEQLVESIAAEFEPKLWTDEYRARVCRLIEAKARGEKISVKAPKPKAESVDLAAQLRRSLSGAKERKVA